MNNTRIDEEIKKLKPFINGSINSLGYNDLKKLKIIGKGTDANIFKLNNQLLLKLYNLKQYDAKAYNSREEILKTIKPTKFVNNFKFQTRCYDEDGVRLGYEDIIMLAIEKQQFVHRSFLPLAPCYIDGHFRGCILKNCEPNIPINFFNFLPEKKKLNIIQKIIFKFKELVENNIYPYDLYNKIDSNSAHNNIILNYRLEPTIIDLDGKSTAYTRNINSEFFYESTFGLTCLILEFLYGQDMSDYFDEYDIFYKQYQDFFQDKIENTYVDKLFKHEIELDDIEEFIQTRKIRKK